MSYLEAQEDGIRIDSSGFTTAYYPHCSVCGNEVMSQKYIRGEKYTCRQCKQKRYFSEQEYRVRADKETKERKFQNAIKRMDKMGCDEDEYKKASEIVHKNLHRDKWFDSAEEIMVAIELVKRKVKARHQVSLGKYRADFVLPEEKVVLEIDGKLFHAARKDKDRIRDELIVLALGPEWEVIRISDEMIDQNIKRLIPAINKVKKQRTLHRKQYNGKLPDWYSDKPL